MTPTQLKSAALEAFKKQYPNITSADMQTFLLGFQACVDIQTELYTKDQVISLLTAVQVFANAYGKEGLMDVKGMNYGERSEHMLSSFLSSSSHIEAVEKFPR